MKGRAEIGRFTPDELIYDALHPLDIKTIELDSGLETVERGTVIAIESGKCVVWDGSAGQEARYIACDDIDTGETPGSKVVAFAYRSGHFNRNSLIFGTGATELTDEAERQLQDAGIYLSTAMK